MLQIKKKGVLTEVNYSLNVLLRVSTLNRYFSFKKRKGSLVILRAPKHFNIGKQKTYSLNYRAYNLFFNRKVNLFLKAFMFDDLFILTRLSKKLNLTTYVQPKSYLINFSTKIKLV